VSAAGAAVVSWSSAIGAAESALAAPREFGKFPSLLAKAILVTPALVYAAIPVAVAAKVRSRRARPSASSVLATVMFMSATQLFFWSSSWWEPPRHARGIDLTFEGLALLGALVLLVATAVPFTLFLLPVARWASREAKGLDEDGRFIASMGIWLAAASAVATVGLAGVGLPSVEIGITGVVVGAWTWLRVRARQRAIGAWLARVRRGEVQGARIRPKTPDERTSLRVLPRLLAKEPCTGVLEMDEESRHDVHPFRDPQRTATQIALVPLVSAG
jgi:hypothetical protein